MNAIEIIKEQIEGLKFDINYDKKHLDEMIEQFKERANRFDVTSIIAWDVSFDQKRIYELYNKIRNENETLQRLQYIIDNANE